jgi:opine dehydrogenase
MKRAETGVDGIANKKVAIIGAGHGGQTIAGVYASLGYDTWLYNHRSRARRIEKIGKRGNTITLDVKSHCNTHGVVREGTFRLGGATYDIGEALKGAALVHIPTSDLAYGEIAAAMARSLDPGSSIILHSCGLGAALEVKEALKRNGCEADGLTIAETSWLPYSTRVKTANGSSDDGNVEVNLVKKGGSVGALPFNETRRIARAMADFFPFSAARNPLEPALNNLGHVFHLPVMLCNTDKWLGKKQWRFYADGYSNPDARELVEELEEERIEMARELGVKIQTSREFLKRSYGIRDIKKPLGKILKDFGYYGRTGPHSASLKAAVSMGLGLRQITEEYYCKLMPLLELARSLKLDTPAMEKTYRMGLELGLKPEKHARKLASLGISRRNAVRDLYEAYSFDE